MTCSCVPIEGLRLTQLRQSFLLGLIATLESSMYEYIINFSSCVTFCR